MFGWLKSQLNIGSGQRLQLMFFNDNSFQFRKLRIQDASLIIKEGEEIKQAWPSFNKLLKPFSGLGNIKATRVLVSCENDIILDAFNELETEEKPTKGGGLVKDWIKNKAATVRYRHQAKPKSGTMANRITIILGCALGVLVFFWAAVASQVYLAGRGG